MKNYLMDIDNELKENFNKLMNQITDTLSLEAIGDKVSEFTKNLEALIDYYTEYIYLNGKQIVDKKLGKEFTTKLTYEEKEFIQEFKDKDITNFCNTLKNAIINCYDNIDNKDLYNQINEIMIGFCIKFFKYSQLLEYKNNNIKNVYLVADNVISCPICQTKSNFIYEVDTLIKNKDDIHPFCKLNIEPYNNKNIINLKLENSTIEFNNISYDIQDRIKNTISQLKIFIPEMLSDKKFIFVNEITEQNEFINMLEDKYGSASNELINQVKEKINSFEYDNNIYISSKIKNIEYYLVKYLLQDKLLNNDLTWWKEEYNKKQTNKYIGDGTAIYVNPFITYIAEQNVESYFLESAIAYILNPSLLKECDNENYRHLKENIFKNMEFVRR